MALIREHPAGPGIEVLLLRRPGNASFAAGAEVFPGGSVEPADLDPAWAELAPSGDPQGLALGLRVAAIRECLEEVGVLLAHRPERSAPAAAARLRSELVRVGSEAFLPGFRREGLRPALADLVFCAHWVTPPGVAVRFDARFFLAALPPGQEVTTVQAEEVSSWRWERPELALTQARQGSSQVLPPTRSVLEGLAEMESTERALAAARTSPVTRVEPRLDEITSRRYPGLDLGRLRGG
ncbi:MAG: NUDIX hydrolase [Candidatus Dormibacteria bacterium]